MSFYQFYVDLFISQIKILDSSVIGSELLVKIHDMEPLYIDTISSKSRGRVTINFNRGLRVFLKMNRTTLPHKVPVIFIAVSDGVQYAGGVNALEIFQESIKFKQPSSIAREHSKLTSSSAHDGAVVLYKLRITVEKVPVIKERTAPDVNCRATDIFRRNEQYRQIYRDLSAQVSFLEAKVDQMKATQKNQTQVKFQRKTVNTQYETTRPKASFENRSRPPIEFQFEDEKKPNRKNRHSDSGSAIAFSDSDPNKFSSQASFEVISDSDNRRDKRRRKNRHASSDSSIEEYPMDESFSNSSGIQDVSGGDIDSVADLGNSDNSIDDVADVDAENGNELEVDIDIVEDDASDSDSDSNKKKKKNQKKKEEKSESNSFESVGNFNDDNDDLNDIKLSENKNSSKTSNGSSRSKKALSGSTASKSLLSETSESNIKKLSSETSGSKKRSSDSRLKNNSSDSKTKKKPSSSAGTLSDFGSNDNSPAQKSPDFESFSSASDSKKDDKKSDSDKKDSQPSDPFASDGSF